MHARMKGAVLKEIFALTICLWLRGGAGGPGLGTPFSYSVPGQANELVLIEWGSNPMELLINDKVPHRAMVLVLVLGSAYEALGSRRSSWGELVPPGWDPAAVQLLHMSGVEVALGVLLPSTPRGTGENC